MGLLSVHQKPLNTASFHLTGKIWLILGQSGCFGLCLDNRIPYAGISSGSLIFNLISKREKFRLEEMGRQFVFDILQIFLSGLRKFEESNENAMSSRYTDFECAFNSNEKRESISARRIFQADPSQSNTMRQLYKRQIKEKMGDGLETVAHTGRREAQVSSPISFYSQTNGLFSSQCRIFLLFVFQWRRKKRES